MDLLRVKTHCKFYHVHEGAPRKAWNKTINRQSLLVVHSVNPNSGYLLKQKPLKHIWEAPFWVICQGSLRDLQNKQPTATALEMEGIVEDTMHYRNKVQRRLLSWNFPECLLPKGPASTVPEGIMQASKGGRPPTALPSYGAYEPHEPLWPNTKGAVVAHIPWW